MNASLSCPDASTLGAYYSERLDQAQRERIAEHLSNCPACRQRVAVLQSASGPQEQQRQPTPDPAGFGTPTAADETKPYPPDWPGANDPSMVLGDRLAAEFLEPSQTAGALGRIGSYDVQEVVGQGGMGIVFRAFDESLHRTVSIKVLAPELAALPKARRRFIREARAAAAINHPNVVTIHAVEEQKGIPYFVMEFVRGVSLGRRIRSKPLDPITVLRISAQIAAGLAAAHEQGVIHRDIKPSNIMLEDKVERVKITDFGLARAAMDLSGLTSVGHAVGTPSYMSPEQVSGGTVDERTDLFSLGCVMYAMLTGHSPFGARHSVEAARKVVDSRPAPLHKLNAEIPRFLSDIVARLLEKDPADRYRSAAELAAVLNRHLAAVNQARSDQLLTALQGSPAPWHRRLAGGRRIRVAVGLGLALAALAAILLLFFSGATGDGTDAHLVVGPGQGADYPTLREALAHAGPNATITLRPGSYNEAVAIDDAERLRGLTLAADEGAVLTAPSTTSAVVSIRTTPGVTIRGLTIRATAEQWPITVVGQVAGLTIERVHLESPPGAEYASIAFWEGAGGTAESPVVLRDARIDSGTFGVYVAGDGGPVSFVRLEGNVFRGDGTHLLLGNDINDIAVRSNIFLGGTNGVNFNFTTPDAAQRIEVSNNTFFGTAYGIGFINCIADQSEVAVRNNLLIESQGIQNLSRSSDEFATAWTFSHNWWQPPGDWGGGTLEPFFERHDEIELLALDESSADFLRPAAGSPLATSGAGGELPRHIGALEPAAPAD